MCVLSTAGIASWATCDGEIGSTCIQSVIILMERLTFVFFQKSLSYKDCELIYYKMKPGGWYLCVFVTTFLYFYIYAVNYVRGATVSSKLETPEFHPPQSKSGYVRRAVQHLYRQGRDAEGEHRDARQGSLGHGLQQPVFPRLPMQYHNYTR